MTSGEGKLAGVMLAVLTLSVGANMMLFQDRKPFAKIETSALRGAWTGGGLETSGAASATRVVQINDEAMNAAEVVRGVQRELNARGYEAGQPDGVPGLVTRAAILAYEFDYGLKLTATPSQDLLSHIVLGTSQPPSGARPAPPRDTTQDASAVIEMVEQGLSSAGYQTGKEKGTLSEQTARAIREFELDQKLPESGRVSGPLMSRLLTLQGGMSSADRVAGLGTPSAKSDTAGPEQAAGADKHLKLKNSAKPAPRTTAAASSKSSKAAKLEKPARSAASR